MGNGEGKVLNWGSSGVVRVGKREAILMGNHDSVPGVRSEVVSGNSLNEGGEQLKECVCGHFME